MSLVYIVVLLVIGFILWYNHRQWEYNKIARQIGGPPGYPLVGHVPYFIKNMNRALITLSQFIDQCGDRLVFFLGPRCVILVNNIEDMEKVCTSTELIGKSAEYDQVKALLGQGLVTSTGQLWAHRRKLITPSFHFSILENFIDPICTHANILADVLMKKIGNSVQFLDIRPFVGRCALDIICETSMGIQMNSQGNSCSAYVEAIQQIGEIYTYRFVRPWLKNDLLWNLTSHGKEERKCLHIIHSFTQQVIADRKRAMLECSNTDTSMYSTSKTSVYEQRVRRPLLDLLFESQARDPDSISDKGIQEETTTFIFAGHDTVSIAISFCLYCLGNHPEIQEKVHQELDAVFEDDPGRPVTLSDLRRLKYLEFCIKETLRLYPSAPYIGREAKKPFRLDEQTLIPAGAEVHFSPYKLHRNPKYWSKPDQFIPERFDPNHEVEFGKPGNFAYIPFSAGQRNCVGQKLAMIEMKIILAVLLRRLQFRSERNGEELQLLSEITLAVAEGLKMKWKPR